MPKNNLMEAAIEAMASSKNKAGSKLPGSDYKEVGGPTYQNSKPDDDSAKVDNAIDVKAQSEKNKPSAASSKTEEVETTEKHKEDIDALFADDSTISEEFKSKVATIFEARILDRVSQIEEQVESKYAGMLEEAVESIKNDLSEKVDDYLSYVVEQWMENNELAIESGLRAELTEDFIGGLRNLFAEHYIDVPTDKVDLVDELAGKVEELESKLNEEIEHNIQLKKSLIESAKNEIAHEVTEGLTSTQAEKVKALAESVDFSTEEEYKEKLETIRENYFPSGTKKANVNDLHEQVEDGSEKKQGSPDPYVNSVMAAISKTKL